MLQRAAKLLDTVAVLHPAPGSGLVAGQVGVVVDVMDDLALVEFADADGKTQATYPVPLNGVLVLTYELVAAE